MYLNLFLCKTIYLINFSGWTGERGEFMFNENRAKMEKNIEIIIYCGRITRSFVDLHYCLFMNFVNCHKDVYTFSMCLSLSITCLALGFSSVCLSLRCLD